MSKNKKDLSNIREEISNIDSEILSLLARRKEFYTNVIEAKESSGSELRDPSREEKILKKALEQAKKLGLDSHYVVSLFNQILADSNRIQRSYLQRKVNPEYAGLDTVKVAYQQSSGKYSLEAASRHFVEKSVVLNHCETMRETFEDVESGKSDFAVVVIENTTSGGNNEVYDYLLHTQLQIIGEVKVKVEPCLIASQQADLKQISEIYCHPRDAILCRNFIAEKNLRINYLGDHETAVAKILEKNDPAIAAISGKLIEDLSDLAIVAENIGNQQEIYHRFIVVGRKPVQVDLRVPAKTSIVFSTNQTPGALAEALDIFKAYNINLTKLESRPVPDNNWEEMFYLDFEGNQSDERIKLLLDELTRKSKFIKVLGTYPIPDVEAVKVKPEHLVQVSREEEVEEAPKVSNKKALIGSRDYKPKDTLIDVRGVKIGGDGFIVMAGPCSVESYDQIMSCAKHANDTGCQILRGGCFKPRTSPYSFQGLGFEGLDMLVNAGRQYGMPVVTEVLSPDDVKKVAEKTDIIQVGARNMQNFTLLSEIGRTQKPVLLKRGMSSSIDDLLNAAEYILAGGNQQVMFCERGIRTFETATRFTLDLSAVPVLKRRSHLPIIIDPSHAAGVRELVPALTIAAKAIGAHGVIVEFHPEPEKALSDGPQALRFSQLTKLMSDLATTPGGDY